MNDTPRPNRRIDQISTRMSAVHDPEQFLLRYGNAVRAYLIAVAGRPDAADEAAQDVLLAVVKGKGAAAWPGRGRFRDYLKVVVRNAAHTHLRKARGKSAGPLPPDLSDGGAAAAEADRVWDAEWHRCVLARVWRELDTHQRRTPGNLFHSVLRATADHPDADSKALAEVVSRKANRPVTADGFRKQLSRARRMMAELIAAEVAATLADPTGEAVQSELIEVGLWPLVRDYLPDDWQIRFMGEAHP